MYQSPQYQNAQNLGTMIGASIGEKREQPPAIALAMEQLEREIHALREGVQRLESRLASVTRPLPQPSQKETLPDGGSPLCGQINTYAQMVRSAAADVYMLLDCLEL